MILPMVSSLLAEMVPTWAISFVVLNRFGQTLQGFDRSNNSLIDTALDLHRVVSGGHQFDAFLENGLSQDSCSGGPVTGDIGSFRSNFLDQLGTHIFKLVFEFDFFGNGHTVFGDQRRTERFLNNNIPPFGAEGHLDPHPPAC